MATVDSSILPEAASYSEKHQVMNEELDDDIASIRAEIQSLSKQRRLLSASLLSSTHIQQQLAQRSATSILPAETQSSLSASQGHAQENACRLALGVTAFPFQEPSTDDIDRRLLGVRFDIANSQGQYEKPYYLLAQRITDSADDLRIHRHTIPSFIPLRKYEEMYLSPQDEGYGSRDTTSDRRQQQDLHGLVKHIRHDLVSWTLRCESIKALQQKLHLSVYALSEAEGEDGLYSDTEKGRCGVRSLKATAFEATQIKIEWNNGAVGRVKISDEGTIEKAVLYDHRGRMRDAEMILTKDSCSVIELASKLEALYEQIYKQTDQEGDGRYA